MTPLPWWEWRTPRERLSTWLKAILGGRRYRVEFDPDLPGPGAIGASGNRLLVLNPTCWDPDTYERWQANKTRLHALPFVIDNWEVWSWLCCKAVGAHEVGHARYSEEPPEETQLARVVNMIDDERVERGMSIRYPVLAPYFDLVGDAQWSQLDPIPEDRRDDPAAVLHAALLWRWEHDLPAISASKIVLSANGQELWERVRPLVEQAWVARSYGAVVALARQILDLLELEPACPAEELPEWLRALLDWLEDGAALNPDGGEPLPDRRSSGIASASHSAGKRPSETHLDDLPPVSSDDRRARGLVHPAPFVDLETRALPWARQLAAVLAVPAPDVEPEPAAYGGRFSLRQSVRDPERPFLAATADGLSPHGMALEILGDRSGSMGWRDEAKMQAAQEGVMALHLACEELGIPHAISLFDDEVVLKEYEHQGELTKALIAGWEGETDEEHIDVLMNERGRRLMQRPEPVKVMVLLHDGRPVVHGEADRIRDWIVKHPEIMVIGVYLSVDLTSDWAQREAARMAGLFPRLVVAEPPTLALKLGAVLRAVRPNQI